MFLLLLTANKSISGFNLQPQNFHFVSIVQALLKLAESAVYFWTNPIVVDDDDANVVD